MLRFVRGFICAVACVSAVQAPVEAGSIASAVEVPHAATELGNGTPGRAVDAGTLLEAPFLLARFSSPAGRKYEIKLGKPGGSFDSAAEAPGMWQGASRNALGAVLAVALLMVLKDVLQSRAESRARMARRRAASSLRGPRLALLAAMKEAALILREEEQKRQTGSAEMAPTKKAAAAASVEERALALREVLPLTVEVADALAEALLRGKDRVSQSAGPASEDGNAARQATKKVGGDEDSKSTEALAAQTNILEGPLASLLRENADLAPTDALLIGEALKTSNRWRP